MTDVSVNESRHFAIDLGKVGYGLGVDAIVIDSQDRFHIQFTYGNASIPISDTYRFSFRTGRWYVSGRDYRTLSRCTDGSIDDSSRYSIDYLTGSVIVNNFRQCKSYNTKRYSVKTRQVTLAQFDPFEPSLQVEGF